MNSYQRQKLYQRAVTVFSKANLLQIDLDMLEGPDHDLTQQAWNVVDAAGELMTSLEFAGKQTSGISGTGGNDE